MNQDFQNKCEQLNDEQLGELLAEVAHAILAREATNSLDDQEIGDLTTLMMAHGIKLWEVLGGGVILRLVRPEWDHTIDYITGEHNEF